MIPNRSGCISGKDGTRAGDFMAHGIHCEALHILKGLYVDHIS